MEEFFFLSVEGIPQPKNGHKAFGNKIWLDLKNDYILLQERNTKTVREYKIKLSNIISLSLGKREHIWETQRHYILEGIPTGLFLFLLCLYVFDNDFSSSLLWGFYGWAATFLFNIIFRRGPKKKNTVDGTVTIDYISEQTKEHKTFVGYYYIFRKDKIVREFFQNF